MLQYIIANSTDKGMVRDVNEDSMVTFDSPNGRVVAVCDGMGGQAAGDVASRLACDVIQDILQNNTFSTPTEAITRAVMAANQGILHRTANSPELEGMGATCVIVIIKDGLVYYGWVGDSRIYYFSNGVLRQISRDQSYVQQLVDSGQISAAEAENHPQKNEITNALGLATMTPPELCPAPLTPEAGSMLLLCSDGLSGMVAVPNMEQILGGNGTLQQKVDALVEAANAAGGYDNITAQLVEFTPAAAAGTGAPAMAPAREAALNAVKRSNRMMTYIAIVLVLILVALGAWFFLGKGEDDPKEGSAPEKVEKIDDERSKKAPKVEKKVIQVQEPQKPAPKAQQPAKSKKNSDPKALEKQINGNKQTKTIQGAAKKVEDKESDKPGLRPDGNTGNGTPMSKEKEGE